MNSWMHISVQCSSLQDLSLSPREKVALRHLRTGLCLSAWLATKQNVLLGYEKYLPIIPSTFHFSLTIRNPTENSTPELCVEVDKDEGLDAAVD